MLSPICAHVLSHINARAYHGRSSEQIEIVTARQREAILEERRTREELINEEVKPSNRHSTPPQMSNWLNAFRWNPDGDLPLDTVARQWFESTGSQSLQLGCTSSSVNEAQLGAWLDERLDARVDARMSEVTRGYDQAIKQMNLRHDNAMQRLRQEMRETAQRNKEYIKKIDDLEECLATVRASHERLERDVINLRTENERLSADNKRLQEMLTATGDNPDALPKLEREVTRLKTEHAGLSDTIAELNKNISRLQTDNAVLTAKATDAQAKLFRMQGGHLRDRENTTRGRCPPSAPVMAPNQQRNRDSPAGSHRSSRTSRSTVGYSQNSNSSYTHVDNDGSRASSQRRRRNSSQSPSQYSTRRYNNRKSASEETRIFGTVHLVEQDSRGRRSIFSLTRIVQKFRSLSRDRGRSAFK